MIEHLARAAMELHHQRTGRKIQSDQSPATPCSKSIAWTQEEKTLCQKLCQEGVSENIIARKLQSRTEAQVRAFLRNAKERQEGQKAVEQDFVDNNLEDTPRKKGRGRKPATQAMNTVPNAKVNSKFLLSGKAL
mmetsp:Transcript_2968/g.5073  ORF Transcript_2968/g.5073 Transcript_2968/m.5073 type:complete len:134 (-) Transcript_2968:159-560(-)